MDESIWALIDELTRWQHEHELSDGAFAKKIGVARSTWATYRLKQKRPGWGFVQKVATTRGLGGIARPYLLGANKEQPA